MIQIKDPSPSVIKDPVKVISKLYEDNPLAWGRIYFPHHFRMPSSDFHGRIIKACLDNRLVAIQAPRESAKSTVVAFLYAFHQIVFQKKRFIVIVQNTYSKAKERLNDIKDEIKNNKMLQEDFGIDIAENSYGEAVAAVTLKLTARGAARKTTTTFSFVQELPRP